MATFFDPISGNLISAPNTGLTIGDLPETIALEDLSDVDATVPTDGQTLTWDQNTTSWKPISNAPAQEIDTVTTPPAKGQVMAWDNGNAKWKPGQASERKSVDVTTASIANGASDDVTLSATGKAGTFVSIETDVAAWVVVYTDQASRTSDVGRAETTDPTPGSGVLVEVITAGAQTIVITPTAGYFNNETIPVDELYLKVTNKSGFTNTVTVTATVLPLE